ncbi:probable flavin-containing monoamine oxidase A [Gigantopelta aegis]|uniref:probable flavin-containing monoamine oxidase A n=1 Tax=Gigantopelta aegis TaxID=1735272 RepID=UPI001B889BA1|nr:probable flavin-containing monoamine oxidase A [Gigantopelta aegis]
MSEEELFDAIVVGAGISGLTAAYHLKQRDPNIRILVLEAKDRVGGRTHTVSIKSANGADVWDLGGQWVSKSQPHIMSLLHELNLETYTQFTEGIKFMQLGDHKIRTYDADIPSLSMLALFDLHRFMSRVDKMRKCITAEDPWKCKNAKIWDAMTVETYKNTLWTKGASDTIDACVRCLLGAEPSQVNFLYFLTYLSAAGGLKQLVEATKNTAQEMKVKGGTQQISQKLAAIIDETSVILKSPVVNIKQESDRVIVTTTAGGVYQTKRVIITVPPSLLGKIQFEPQLPVFKQDYARRMPLGSTIKIIVTFQTAFWRSNGWSGEVVTSGGSSTVEHCDSGPLCIVYDATSAKEQPALVAFISARQAVQWSQLNADERKRGVLESLSRFFGPEVFTYLDYIEKDWSREPYSEGGPVGVATTGAMQYFSRSLRQPFGKLHFAGTETATMWCGYMDGAVQSGIRAATEVLRLIRPDLVTPEDLDILNTQQKGCNKPVKHTGHGKVAKCVLTFSIVAAGLFLVTRFSCIHSKLKNIS